MSKLDAIRALRERHNGRSKSRSNGNRDRDAAKPTGPRVPKRTPALRKAARNKAGRPRKTKDGTALDTALASPTIKNRSMKFGPRRLEDKVTVPSLSETKPWEALGMSRRTWFRRQAEKRAEK